jgi:hypothetical protein
MKIPRYWTKASHTGAGPKGKELSCSAWGWSLDSVAAAKEDAQARARRVFDALVSGRRPDTYEYTDRPLREEIVEPLRQGDREIALITRNRYGALVLNTASVLFVDVDFPKVTPNGLWDAVLLSLSAKRRQWRQAAARELTLESVRNWARRNAGHSFRVYRTCAGLRLLFTDRLHEPKSEETSRLLAELGSDRLYRRLTSNQECFRARLTPKPWRCGCDRPPNRYPWSDEGAERRYRHWERRYAAAAESYGVCELLETCGEAIANGEVAAVIETHDHLTCDDTQRRKLA